jgi:lysine/ornithine N-monooxygenase
MTKIKGKIVEFEGGNEGSFDAIVFATGYKSTANRWLKVVALLRFECPSVISLHATFVIYSNVSNVIYLCRMARTC